VREKIEQLKLEIGRWEDVSRSTDFC
jgi:hypothetical protein